MDVMLKFTAWKPRMILPALGCAVLILATLMWHWQSRAASGTPSPASPAPTPVEVAAATHADVPVYLEGLGTVQGMTTMAALLGSLPLMLGHGTGSELRQPL